MGEVAAVRTPQAPEQLRAALQSRGVTAANQLALLLALLMIETANGQNLFNHNVGNIMADDTQEAPFWRPPWFDEPGPDTSDRNREKHEAMLRGEAPRAFRSYGSLPEGMASFVSLLERKFPTMLEANTPELFTEAWRNSGYSPFLDVEKTTPNVRTLFTRFGGSAETIHDDGDVIDFLDVAFPIGLSLGFAWLKRRFG